MPTQDKLGWTFRALHESGTFVIPNPWDVGSARILASMGFRALATTSGGFAFSVGKRDHTPGRDDVLEHCRALISAVDVPVSADLGNCFGDDPKTVAETMRLAAASGLVGAYVEDMKGDYSIYDHALAAERVQAAAEVTQALPFPFTLTARAENFLVGRHDLDDTIKRLQLYQEAGADVLYAPGLTTREEISAVVRSVDRPVNVIMGIRDCSLTIADLQELEVRRISVGSSLARVAITAFIRATREMLERGTFSFSDDLMSFREINSMLGAQANIHS